LRPTTSSGESTGYASALDDLWQGVLPAVAELEHTAAEPGERLEDCDLARLRYELHRGAEVAHGLAAPAGAVGSHAELADALAEARDATAAVAEALADGGVEAASALVWEWRGSLFRVRLARLRMRNEPAPSDRLDDRPGPGIRAPLAATGLLVAGVALVLGGALAEVWPLWTGGIALVLGSMALSVRQP
jgi:hypothetical protein